MGQKVGQNDLFSKINHVTCSNKRFKAVLSHSRPIIARASSQKAVKRAILGPKGGGSKRTKRGRKDIFPKVTADDLGRSNRGFQAMILDNGPSVTSKLLLRVRDHCR